MGTALPLSMGALGLTVLLTVPFLRPSDAASAALSD